MGDMNHGIDELTGILACVDQPVASSKQVFDQHLLLVQLVAIKGQGVAMMMRLNMMFAPRKSITVMLSMSASRSPVSDQTKRTDIMFF